VSIRLERKFRRRDLAKQRIERRNERRTEVGDLQSEREVTVLNCDTGPRTTTVAKARGVER
jgi:hypothetical protein